MSEYYLWVVDLGRLKFEQIRKLSLGRNPRACSVGF